MTSGGQCALSERSRSPGRRRALLSSLGGSGDGAQLRFGLCGVIRDKNSFQPEELERLYHQSLSPGGGCKHGPVIHHDECFLLDNDRYTGSTSR